MEWFLFFSIVLVFIHSTTYISLSFRVCSSVYFFELILLAEINAHSFPLFPNLISTNTAVMEIDRRRGATMG